MVTINQISLMLLHMYLWLKRGFVYTLLSLFYFFRVKLFTWLVTELLKQKF